jgi:hypothetical protein
MRENPKFLRQTTTGRIYAYSPGIAGRRDMVPVVETVPPVIPDVKQESGPADLTPKVEATVPPAKIETPKVAETPTAAVPEAPKVDPPKAYSAASAKKTAAKKG